MTELPVRYLGLLCADLCNMNYLESEPILRHPNWDWSEDLERRYALRADGTDYPTMAFTMVGINRLSQTADCALDVTNVPGSFVDIGIWRGGTTAIMAAVAGMNDPPRRVFGIDTFEGFPEGSEHAEWNEWLAVPREQVQKMLYRYSLSRHVTLWTPDEIALDGEVALLRIDVDEYEPTLGYLNRFIPLMAKGGIVIMDDYGNPALEGVEQAVRDHYGDRFDELEIQKDVPGAAWWTV